jgi:L-lactate dehydrogenase complex protein LldG
MERDAFLAQVRQAARAGSAYRVAADERIDLRAAGVPVHGDLCTRLAEAIIAAGGSARVVPNRAAAAALLAEQLAALQPRTALCWRHDVLDRLELAAILQRHGVEPIDHDALAALPRDEQRRRMLAADVGITSADFAVAETGSLACLSRPGQERLASLAPPRHVAVVERRQIVPDLFELFARLETPGEGDLPSNLVLITGPSKTGDIELQLTTGVHGPGQWDVIVIDSD